MERTDAMTYCLRAYYHQGNRRISKNLGLYDGESGEAAISAMRGEASGADPSPVLLRILAALPADAAIVAFTEDEALRPENR
jgi:hypothetical protein